MRERISDSLPRRPSPSRTTDGDGNESSRYKRRHVSSRSDQPPVRIDGREEYVDGIRRECGYSSSYEVERQMRDGFSNKDREEEEEERDNERYRKHYHLQKHALISGDDYPNRSDPTERVHHGLRGLNRSAEDTCGGHDAEPSRSMMKKCLSDEPEHSRFITPRDYKYSPSQERRNVSRNDEIEQLESNSRDNNDSSRRRLNTYPTTEQEQTEAIFVAMKGEHYGDDGRDRDTPVQESSPLSQIGSSVVDLQDENSRRSVRVNDSDDYNVLQSRHLEDYVGRNSSREQGKSFEDLSYSHDFSCGDHDSPAMSRSGKEIVDESRTNYQAGYDTAAREISCVRHDVKNMAGETHVFMQTRECGSNIVDATDTNLEFITRERMTGQYDFVKEHYPLVEKGSSMVNEREDQAHHYREVCYDEQRKVVSLDNKCQLLRKDYQYDGVDSRKHLDFTGPDVVTDGDDMVQQYRRDVCYDEQRKVVSLDNNCQLLRKDHQYDGVDSRKYLDLSGPDVVRDRYDKAPQSITLCLNKEREAYLDNERKAAYSDDKRRELRNDYYHFGNDGRMHSDVHGEDTVVDREGRIVQLQQVSLNKGNAAYLDNERKDVYLHHKSQQLRKDYDDSGTDTRVYPDVNRLDSVVDREDARYPRYRGVFLNDTKEAYFQCERQQVPKYHETDSYGMMHPNVDREDGRGLRYRGVSVNEAYLQCERQQLLKDGETDSYAMMHPIINKSDILVDREDIRGLRYRGGSFNARKEAYLQCESQQLLKDGETDSYGMMHPGINKSYFLADREDARALERRGVSFDDGNESYLENERRDAYLRYRSQQLKKGYDYGTDDRIYRDVNRSDIGLDHGDAKALELSRVCFNDGHEAYLDTESKDVHMHYKIPQSKKDYYSGIDTGMYHDVNRSEIVVDREVASAIELRRGSLNNGREAYFHYENNQLLKDYEIDVYEMMMHPDISRSSARKQDEEALRSRRYLIDDDRNQVYLNDEERLQLRNGGHVKVHANRRYHSNDEMLLTRDDDYGVRDEAGEVIHENMAGDYINYSDVEQLGMSYEKLDHSGRFQGHHYRDKLRSYAVEGGARTEQYRNLVYDEGSFGNEGHHASTMRPRISAKDRLGGRVEDSRVHVKYRGLHQVKNSNRKGKLHNRIKNQKNVS